MKVLIVFAFCLVTCYAQTIHLVDVPFTVETGIIGGGNRNGNLRNFPQQQPQTPRQNFGRNSQIFFQPQPIQRQQPQPQIRGQNRGRMIQTPIIVQQPQQIQRQQPQPQIRRQNRVPSVRSPIIVQQPQQRQQPPNRGQNFQRSPHPFQQPRRQSWSRVNNNNSNAPAQIFLLPLNLDNLNSQPAPVPRTRSQPIRNSSPRRNNRQGTQADPIFEIDLSQLQDL